MGCQTIYDEMMSTYLDGLLDTEDEHRLLAHIADCEHCAPFWDAMQQANALLVASAHEPVAVPDGFAVKIMVRVSQTTVVRPLFEQEAAPVYHVPAISVL